MLGLSGCGSRRVQTQTCERFIDRERRLGAFRRSDNREVNTVAHIASDVESVDAHGRENFATDGAVVASECRFTARPRVRPNA